MISALAAAIAISAAATTYAGWGQRGGGYGNSNMQAPGPQMQMQYNQVDPAVREKLDKFFTDTQDIRKEIAVKQAEKMALVRSDNPDPEAAGKLAGELFDLRITMHEKAVEAGVSEYLGPMNGQRGGRGLQANGPGMNRGGMNKGGRFMNDMQNRPGPRWN
jgi:zinc resistance-associated protein